MPDYYILGAIICAAVMSGWLYSDFEAIHSDPRENAGAAILFAIFLSLVWPIGVIAIFCLTGFAQHGCWKRRKHNGSS